MAPESLDSGVYTSKSDVWVYKVYRALIVGGGGGGLLTYIFHVLFWAQRLQM